MQPIQDKDFDQLFKNSFEDAEIMPSRDLWSNIKSEIEPKKKRIIPIYWLSAAAVLLIIAAGVLVYKQQEVKPKQYANNISPKIEKPIVKEQPLKDSLTSKAVQVDIQSTSVASNKPDKIQNKTNAKDKGEPVEIQKIISAPEIQKQEMMIVRVEEPKKDIKTKIEEAIFQTKEETVLAANVNEDVADEAIESNNPTDRKGIRNVGDVVNLIVNKMDKRKDKLIQFRTDDDDSSISVVNIGPFRLGNKNRK